MQVYQVCLEDRQAISDFFLNRGVLEIVSGIRALEKKL